MALRRFQFFDKEARSSAALSCLDVTCGASGRGVLVLGTSEGQVLFCDRDLAAVAFQAHRSRVTPLPLQPSHRAQRPRTPPSTWLWRRAPQRSSATAGLWKT